MRSAIRLNEYKSEAFQLFESLLNRLRLEVTRMLAHVQVMTPEEQQAMIARLQAQAQAQALAAQVAAGQLAPADLPADAPAQAGAVPAQQAMAAAAAPAAAVDPADPGTWGRSGRNDSCPCGSGKKFKHCHGKV